MSDKLKIDEVEIGHGFFTVWGYPTLELREFAAAFYTLMPKEIQEINPPRLNYHNPPLFHPYGTGEEVGRKHYKHFHVLWPAAPTKEDTENFVDVIKQLYLHRYKESSNLRVGSLEEHQKEGIDESVALNRSLELYVEELHKDEIYE